MKKIKLRHVVQLSVFALVIFLSLMHMNYGIEKAASIDAFCPFGAVESFLTLITTGSFINRVYVVSFILLGITMLTTLLFGRIFCSHICPLGAIQEWIRKLGEKFGIKEFVVPEKLDKYLRYFKYITLGLIVFLSFKTGELVFREYDPYVAMMHLGNEIAEKYIAYLILLIILIGSLFTKNLWCRYFCPLGGFLGIIKKVSPFKIERDEKSCTSCGVCNKKCPANLDIQNSKIIKSADCISCGDCISSCPRSSLKMKIFNKTINKNIFFIMVIVSFFLPIMIFKITPLWQTKPASNIIEMNGNVNVDNIKGSNTLKYLIEELNIPLDIFVKELNIPKDVDQTLKLKEIGEKYNIKNSDGEIIETEDFRAVIEKLK